MPTDASIKADTTFKPQTPPNLVKSRLKLRPIKRDSTDEDFRRNTADLIDSAKKEILIITGEASAYDYPDLKWAAERARKRDVSIKVYASNLPQRVVNGFLSRGVRVFKGPKVADHYLVIDGKSYIHSRPHPPAIGARAGEVHENEPKGAAQIVRKFEKLVAKSEELREIDWKHDPLWKALQKPWNWGVDTHASRLDEEFA